MTVPARLPGPLYAHTTHQQLPSPPSLPALPQLPPVAPVVQPDPTTASADEYAAKPSTDPSSNPLLDALLSGDSEGGFKTTSAEVSRVRCMCSSSCAAADEAQGWTQTGAGITAVAHTPALPALALPLCRRTPLSSPPTAAWAWR